jgi:hypothetical protein
MHTRFWGEDLKERNSLDGQGVDVSIVLKLILIREGGRAWTELISVMTKKM